MTATIFILAVRCSSPKAPAFGFLKGNDYTFLRAVTFSCEEGYAIDGSNSISCGYDGEWSSDSPKCRPVMCPSLKEPLHATLNGTNRTYTSVIGAECILGYRLPAGGVANVQCMSSGLWSQQLTDCVLVECPVEVVPSNTEILMAIAIYRGRLVARCLTGFVQTSGNTTRQCTATGQWTGQTLLCTGELCTVCVRVC